LRPHPREKDKKTLPIISFGRDTQFLDLALDSRERLRSGAEKVELGLGDLVEILERLRLIVKQSQFLQRYQGGVLAHVLQDRLHERNRNLCLLNEIVFGILNLQTDVFLLRRASVLKTAANQQLLVKERKWEYARLLGRIKFEPTKLDSIPRLHRNRNALIQRRLPRVQIVIRNRIVLLNPRSRDAIPTFRIKRQRLSKPICTSSSDDSLAGAACRGGNIVRSSMRSAGKRMWQRLHCMKRRRAGRCRDREIGALEVVRSERGDVVPYRARQLRDGFLHLRRIIVRVVGVDLGDPMYTSISTLEMPMYLTILEESDMRVAKGVNTGFKVLVF